MDASRDMLRFADGSMPAGAWRRRLISLIGLSSAARRFLAGEIRPRRYRLAGLLALSLVAALIEMTGVGLIFPLLIIIVSPEQIDRFASVAWLIDSLGIGRGFALSVLLMSLIAVLMIGKNAYMIGFNWLQMRMLAHWKTATGSRLMRMYIYSDYSLHLVKNSSEIIRNLALTTAVYDHYITGLIQVVVNGLMLAALVLLLLIILPLAAAYGMMAILLVAVAMYRGTRGLFRDIGAEQNELFEQRQRILQQSIGMVKETKIAARERFFLDAFCGVEGRNFLKQAHYNLLSTIAPLVTEAAVIAAVLGVVSYIVFISPQPGTGIATLGLLAATLFRMTPLINRMLSALQMMNLGRDAVEILGRELVELEAQVYIPEHEPDPLPFERTISLQDVSFTYPTGVAFALREVSLTIHKNETIGITGPSGSGKSTLAAILMGLLVPTSGAVAIDGVPLDDRGRLRAWHKNLGYVQQGVFLIDDTIARNIALAQQCDHIDERRIWEVLATVQLREFVESLPKGIHHHVGEDGVALSGGQRQRLGIARVLYLNPSVLLLDEATSALDVAAERAFSENLMRLKKTRTLIIIAHRLSTLRDCDRIVMLDQGRIVDVAPFDELERRCPAFRRLAALSRIGRAS
jgi:ABC-type multidrug transport system fused ATPase/permease subunit